MTELEESITRVLDAERVTDALAAGRRLRALVGEAPSAHCERIVAALEAADRLGECLFIAALGRSRHELAGAILADLLESFSAQRREHAAWALAERPPVEQAVPLLVRMVAAGGFDGMVAQRTLEAWRAEPVIVLPHLLARLSLETERQPRRRLAETVGLSPHDEARRLLVRLLRDPGEHAVVRAAAARALPASRLFHCLDPLEALAADADAGAARSARTRLGALLGPRVLDAGDASASGPRAEGARARAERQTATRGLHVAQVVLQGRLDAGNRGGGIGDSGGLATLVASLGRLLGRQPGIACSSLVCRSVQGSGIPEEYGRARSELGGSGSIHRLPFGPEGDLDAPGMWPYRVEIELALRRLLRRIDVDAVHLRFADAGTLAARKVCREMGIPVFFSLAPDPHAVIEAAQDAGELDRGSFATADRREHYLFRARLVEGLASEAHGLALFPRPGQSRALARLVGFDTESTVATGRALSVPEGIDHEVHLRARLRVTAAVEEGRPDRLVERVWRKVARLPMKRQGLPLLTAVGRLHPVKGIPRLVQAWAGEPRLRNRFNLALAGGNLIRPNANESRVLTDLSAILDRFPSAREGMLLLGNLANEQVASLLAVTSTGLNPLVDGHGLFACPSDKEEFGLAILEAMYAGLPVVAPDKGGPATYVRDGENGFLVSPGSVEDLREALLRAAARRHDEVLTRRARATVAESYTADRMAHTLAGFYQDRLGRLVTATLA